MVLVIITFVLNAISTQGELHDVFDLLDKSTEDINFRDAEGKTPLLIAVLEGNLVIVQVLLQHGADPNLCDHNGNTPLILAAYFGHFDIAKALVEAKADVQARDEEGSRALCYAAQQDNLDIVKYLVEQTDSDIHHQNFKRVTPLMKCVGHFEVFEYLAGLGSDINAVNVNHADALLAALAGDHLNTVTFLLDNGVNVDQQDYQGVTPLFMACHKQLTYLVKRLLEAGANPNIMTSQIVTPLQAAAATDEGCAEIAALLIQHGADVNFVDEKGVSALNIAALKGHSEFAEVLIKHKADVNNITKSGHSPLFLASHKGHEQVAKHLIKAKAHVDIQDKDGDTALLMACQEGHFQIVKMLIKAGASINYVNFKGVTAIDRAVYNKFTDITQFLVDNGANVHSQAIRREQLIHLSVQNDDVETTQVLIDNGADKVSIYLMRCSEAKHS